MKCIYCNAEYKFASSYDIHLAFEHHSKVKMKFRDSKMNDIITRAMKMPK